MPNLPKRLRPNSGFSLVEMLIAIVVAGLLMAIALPKVRETVIRSEVRSARSAVASMYARARIHALQTRKSTVVNFNATKAWVTTTDGGGGLDTVGAVLNLTNAYGVAVAYTAPLIKFQPTGLTNVGAPVTVRVTRAGKADSVVISGYGRLQ
ncbi:MAG TPA: GspH/FimT family pseudopilin [Gemmatimonadales bacterium]|jgi:prepilin-type N-terminal cleavage/methylation domain-containing protein